MYFSVDNFVSLVDYEIKVFVVYFSFCFFTMVKEFITSQFLKQL